MAWRSVHVCVCYYAAAIPLLLLVAAWMSGIAACPPHRCYCCIAGRACIEGVGGGSGHSEVQDEGSAKWREGISERVWLLVLCVGLCGFVWFVGEKNGGVAMMTRVMTCVCVRVRSEGASNFNRHNRHTKYTQKYRHILLYLSPQ